MKYKKRELLQTIATLEKVNQEIKSATIFKLISMGDILAQCQKAAIEIGTCLEAEGGNILPIVKVLEDYCENVYVQSENLQNPDVCRKLAKKIQKQINEISNAIKYDLPEDRKEIVFLPYKASMWDSLESAYLEEKKNVNNDVYCIPIPYYDLNPDHSFGTMHDEGGNYPETIEITDWRTYHLEERRPDKIYIHNPYDNWNHVTSVHPDFYACNLRKYTDMLIYLPYFVLGEVDPDDPKAVEKVSHFCFLPGVIYADKVIVESENMKQIYVNTYLAEAARSGLTGKHLERKYLEKKIQGLGSPKYEKIMRTRKEDLVMPESWEKIMQRGDGQFKKIVLYNTGVSALLQDEKGWMEKLEDSLQTFQERRDDVTLIWRPHPLIESTMQAMRPEVLQRYLEIKRRYLGDGWGIFDDSTDVTRAVIVSDIYYGDFSSVVFLYQKTGKPVVIQTGKIRNAGIKYKEIQCLTACCNQTCIWLMLDRTSTLMQYDLQKEKIIRKSSINEKITENLFLASVQIGEVIYYAPYNAKNMWCYNTVMDSWTIVDIGLTNAEKKCKRKYNKIFYYQDKLFLFGVTMYHIAVYDINTGLTKRYDQYIRYLAEKGYSKEDICLFNECEICGDKIYFTSCKGSMITVVNLQTLDIKLHDLKWDVNELGGIAYDKGDTFLISDDKDNIIVWDENKGIVGHKKINALQSSKKCYREIYCRPDKTICFAKYEDRIVIECKDGERKVISLQKEEGEKDLFGVYDQYGFIEKIGDSIFFQHIRLGKIFRLDMIEETVMQMNVSLEEEEYAQIINSAIRAHSGEIRENPDFSLANLIEAIQV